MAHAIVKQLSREVGHAYVNGKSIVKVLGKTFKLENVSGNHWRLTDESGNDIGFRFDVIGKKLSFFLA